ncbi:MAG: SDR family NAD(P)-dependent oxidoreductase [Candidatus Omnitrophota bacterium]
MKKLKNNFYSGMNVLLTGASSGIGRKLALQLLDYGANVFAVSRDISKLQELALQIKNKPGKLLIFSTDISKYENCKLILEDFSRNFNKLDLLINNAGLGHFSAFLFTKKEDYEYIIQTNLMAPLYLTQLFFRLLKKSNKGRIVNICSNGAFYGVPFRSIYCSAKAGLRAWSQALSLELKYFGIELFTVIPGSTKTSFFDNQIGKAPKAHRLPGKIELPEVLAAKVLKDVQGRGKELNYALSSRAILYLSVLIPGLLKKIIGRAVKSEEEDVYRFLKNE